MTVEDRVLAHKRGSGAAAPGSDKRKVKSRGLAPQALVGPTTMGYPDT